MPHCTLNFLLCGNQPLSAPGQLISFQPAFLGSPRVPSALLALFFVATNHFWSLANSFHFTLLPKNLYFLDPPGCPVPFWHSSLWQTTTFGPLPSHCGSPCFPKTCVSWPLLGSQCPPGTFLCGSQPLSAPGQLFSFHLTSQKTCVSWLPLGAKCLPGTFLCVCGRPPLSAPGQLISFPLAFQKIVFLGSPWVPSALLALFFIVANHLWPLAHSFRFTLLSKGLYFLASSGHYVVRTLLALFL